MVPAYETMAASGISVPPPGVACVVVFPAEPCGVLPDDFLRYTRVPSSLGRFSDFILIVLLLLFKLLLLLLFQAFVCCVVGVFVVVLRVKSDHRLPLPLLVDDFVVEEVA